MSRSNSSSHFQLDITSITALVQPNRETAGQLTRGSTNSVVTRYEFLTVAFWDVTFCSCEPWRQGQYVFPKRWLLSTRLYGITFPIRAELTVFCFPGLKFNFPQIPSVMSNAGGSLNGFSAHYYYQVFVKQLFRQIMIKIFYFPSKVVTLAIHFDF